ncbi:hypothetical protein WNY51_18540 [Pseudocolwellia sp. AS88]|uniref:hypothetical protein n=1 Tax=Pseudocolwellia sp. AS88 TaxID=3063958 RepID=UPI0026EC5035|nr:hypothetical protein [Pseudocolwellia sp. AS88]MDO7086550.1 hypothetical protein [Pseudocolwellia sp. AS88]
MEFEKDSEQSIVFIFDFPTITTLKSSFTKLQCSFGTNETEIRENKNGTFQLRVTRIIPYNEPSINKHKNELIEDLTYYSGKFREFKVHKISLDGVITNKRISNYTKALTFLSKIGGTKPYKKYDVPLFSVLAVIFVIIFFSVLKI